MVEFIYKEFSKNVSQWPWRSVSFILSFACTYFILIFSFFIVKNIFYNFEVATKDYQVLILLSNEADASKIDSVRKGLLKINRNLQIEFLESNEVYKLMIKDEAQDLDLEPEDIDKYVPKVLKVMFEDFSSLKKILVTKEISDTYVGKNLISEIITPYKELQYFAKIYFENKLRLIFFVSSLYFSIFILIYLLLSLSLREHKTKIDLFRILGFKKNLIRWPLILEGIFLSSVGFLFAMALMYALYLQISMEYEQIVNLSFFNYQEMVLHLLVSVSFVFFLTSLMTQKIIKEDFIEN